MKRLPGDRVQNSKPIPWSAEQIALLQELRAAKIPWETIAEQCGHSANSCSAMHSMTRRRQIKEAQGNAPKKAPRWSETDVSEMKRLRAEGLCFADIDSALGKGKGAACSKWYSLRAPQRQRLSCNTARQDPVSRGALVEHVSLTAKFCGDPLPGRSALDRKRAGISDDARRPSLATLPSEERAT